MTESSKTSRVDLVVLGIFLTMFVQSQFGSFDKFYDSLLLTLALQDEASWARALYHLLGQTEFAAKMRADNPIGFFLLNGIFCATLAELVSVPIRLIAFLFGRLEAGGAPEGDVPEQIEDAPELLPEPTAR